MLVARLVVPAAPLLFALLQHPLLPYSPLHYFLLLVMPPLCHQQPHLPSPLQQRLQQQRERRREGRA